MTGGSGLYQVNYVSDEKRGLAEIAAVLEVSIPCVHQIKASALHALRQMLEPADQD